MRHRQGNLKGSRPSDARLRRVARRRLVSFAPRLRRLEDRLLLAGDAPAALSPDRAALAAPLGLDSPLVGSIAAQGAIFYQVSIDAAGKFTARLTASGFPARISLVDAQGKPLVQSDSTASGQGLIELSVPQGVSYLEVESLGPGGTYRISAALTPAVPAFQAVPAYFAGGGSSLVVFDVDGDGVPDLVAPDGIHPGVGDGTFQSEVVGGSLAADDFDVTSILSGDFDGDGRTDLAVLETAQDYSTANVRILRNLGGGQFGLVDTIDVSPDSGTIQMIDFGGGVVDLAVADPFAGQVAILVGDGTGSFSYGPVLDSGFIMPTAMLAGRFSDGRIDLIVADQGDQDTGEGAGLAVFHVDRPDQFRFAGRIDDGSSPGALLAADLDGDGSLDLAVADSDSADVSIFLNNGEGGFEAPQDYLVGSLPRSIVAFSSRGNGTLDLAVANSNSSDVSILLNNGDGTFQPQVRFSAGVNPVSLVSADLNGDGVPDLAAADTGSDAGEVVVLLGRGDGTFQDEGSNPVGNAPLGGVSVDLNHDGRADVVTVNRLSNDVSVLLGNGDGTFQPARFFPVGVGPTAVTVGDFNRDGRIDAAVAIGSNGVAILMGNGDGTFQPAIFRNTARFRLMDVFATSIVAGDFTGDGVLDLAVANRGSNDVSILEGDGRGGFNPLAPIHLEGAGSDPVSILTGDFTGDGVLDLAVVGRGSKSVSILEGDGRGGFDPLAPIPLVSGPNDRPAAGAVGDFTGDGVLDLAVLIAGRNDTVKIFPGLDQGRFGAAVSITLGRSLGSTSIIAGRFFGNRWFDLAVAESNRGAVSLIRSDGAAGFELLPMLKLGDGGYPKSVLSGDFNNDGKTDLAVGRQGPNSVAVELNQGGGVFADPASVGLSPHNTPLVADVDGDGVSDMTIVDGAGNILFRRGRPGRPGSYDPPVTVNVGLPARDVAAVDTDQGVFLAGVNANNPMVSLFSYRGGGFVLVRSLATGRGPAQVVAADLTGSGIADGLIVRNAEDGTVSIYQGDLLGLAPSRTDLDAGDDNSDVSVADVDGDGLPDVLLANQVFGEVEVIRNQGSGRFSPPTRYRAGTGLMALTEAADASPASIVSRERTAGVVAVSLTRGGLASLVTVNPGSATLGVLRGLGGSRFANPVALQTSGQASIVRAGDFNGDGDADLAILGTDGLTIRFGDGQGAFFPAATYDVGPAPTGLRVADVNRDGKPDLVVGDAAGDVLILQGDGQGAFRPPVAADRAVSIAAADLKGKGTPTFVYADQARDRVVVRDGPTASSASALVGDDTSGLLLPGSPTLADLDGDGRPDLIVTNSGGNSVLVYPGLGDGSFGREVEGGSGFFTGTNPSAVVVGDVNDDGRPDLIVADKGANDVFVLFNQSRGSDIAFSNGPRLAAGPGPTALALSDVNGDGVPDVLVSNGSSNEVRVLPGIGGGYFDDGRPTVVPLASAPGALIIGYFGGGAEPDVVALNPGTPYVTRISGLSTGVPTTRLFPSGGVSPVAGIVVSGSNGFDNLVVANNTDGNVALLMGGASGLTVDRDQVRNVPNPTSLAFATIPGGNIEVYAATEGNEFATILLFSLGGSTGLPPVSGVQSLTLIASQDSSLPLIATLLTTIVTLDSDETEPGAGEEQGTVATTVPTTNANPFGQSVPSNISDDEEHGDDEDVPADGGGKTSSPDDEDAPALASWLRSVLGLDDAFEDFRLNQPPEAAPAAETQETPAAVPPTTPGPPDEEPSNPRSVGQATRREELIDTALNALTEETVRVRPAVSEFVLDEPQAPTPIVQAVALGGLALIANRPVRIIRRPGPGGERPTPRTGKSGGQARPRRPA